MGINLLGFSSAASCRESRAWPWSLDGIMFTGVFLSHLTQGIMNPSVNFMNYVRRCESYLETLLAKNKANHLQPNHLQSKFMLLYYFTVLAKIDSACMDF